MKKTYIIAILCLVALVSVVSVALAAIPDSAKAQTDTSSQPVRVNADPMLDMATGSIDVSFGLVLREIVITALLFTGSVVVLKKK
ncbi:MAG: hypothetical protein CVV39_03970 [Planctomycetes bacterium HGW-Planctomycetes-1]|nr:MAG: hypothetical protein CVV39_03970 [Planctomycetes bacterium HGW-Planctomycetes-1]